MVENHSQTMIIDLKRLKSSKFVRAKAFPMYGGIDLSAPSLHRESADSLSVSDYSEPFWHAYYTEPFLLYRVILTC